MDKKESGASGEAVAALYLQKHRYRIVEKNYAWKGGEIDIIAVKKNEIIFCEVKKRNTISYGTGAEAVNRSKIRKIILTAKKYLAASQEYNDYSVRFDVIEIQKGAVRHIKGAFIDE